MTFNLTQWENPLVVAEIGLNHNGDFSLAEKMIIAAAEAGANAVKFQSFNPSKMVSPKAPSLLKGEGEEDSKTFGEYGQGECYEEYRYHKRVSPS